MSRLRLTIQGEHGQITLASFVGILTRANLILSGLDSAISENPKGALEWYIADLKVGSAEAIIESRAIAPEVDAERLGTMVSANFVSGLDVIEREAQMPPYFSDQDLGRVKAIAKLLKRTDSEGLEAAHLNGSTTPLEQTTVRQDAAEKVALILRPQFKGVGSVVGKLEVISVHGPAKFNVYDVLTKKAVSCRFEREKQDEIAAALGRRVVVTGIVHRNAHGDPVKVEKPELRILPDGIEPPSARDLIGLVPDMTGALSAEEYIRKLRNG
ncbi:MAG TPA: hypothetical protein VFW41_00135 [Gaiellaceae bacterium]|nr:hypothetical protein [Gaiellaceae bacterium]